MAINHRDPYAICYVDGEHATRFTQTRVQNSAEAREAGVNLHIVRTCPTLEEARDWLPRYNSDTDVFFIGHSTSGWAPDWSRA
ncbi:MAG: hypothetical protein WAV90_18140 [Gordonia amarae]